MKFVINTRATDKDYLEYNLFWAFRSHYGKKQMLSYRIILTFILLIPAAYFLISRDFEAAAFIGIIPHIVLLLIFQLLLKKGFELFFKSHIKSLKKRGKMGYSAESVMEFYEDFFTETTDSGKTEHNYSVVERVSIICGKTIYIHINNIMAYMLPISCFESLEQYNEFVAFLNKKCSNIDVYQ